MKKLMCPQCGATLFYVPSPQNPQEKLYLNVTFEQEVLPFKEEYAQVKQMQIELVHCSACSWQGPLKKLKKVFFG